MAAAAVVACLVFAAGVPLAGPAGRTGVGFGVATGFLLQMIFFWLFAVVWFPTQPLLAFGVGMLGRMLVVAAVGLLVAPALGLPVAPVLLSMVSVFFVTALLEPVFLIPASSSKS